MARVERGGIREIICATNPTPRAKPPFSTSPASVKPHGVRLTRLAHGLPVGGHLEYADDITLSRSLEGRHDL